MHISKDTREKKMAHEYYMLVKYFKKFISNIPMVNKVSFGESAIVNALLFSLTD